MAWARGTPPSRRASDPTAAGDISLRRAEAADADQVGDVWLAAFAATYDFPPSHTEMEVRAWLRDQIVGRQETWVAVEPDGTVAGFMALDDHMLDQLYIRPGRTGQGLGSRFVALAKSRRADGLDLYTFQANTGARRFYERHGFRSDRLRRRCPERGAPTGCRLPLAARGLAMTVDPGRGTTTSLDGTAIAWFRSGDGPPIVLVHGATADHTAWRTSRAPAGLEPHPLRDRSARARSQRRHGALRHRP